jgi:hypothetical protein
VSRKWSIVVLLRLKIGADLILQLRVGVDLVEQRSGLGNQFGQKLVLADVAVTGK